MSEKISLSVDLKSGDRSGLLDTQKLADFSRQLEQNFQAADAHTKSLAEHIEHTARKIQHHEPVSRREHERMRENVKLLKERADHTKRLAQLEGDTSRGRVLNARAEAAAGLAGRAGAMMTGGGGGKPGMMSRVGGAIGGLPGMIGGALGYAPSHESLGDRITGTIRSVRETIGHGITHGLGIAGLFEGLSMIHGAMEAVDAKEKALMRTGALLGGSFETLRSRVGNLRDAWGFTSMEGLGAAATTAHLGGMTNRGRIMGAGMFARAFGGDINEVAGSLATFERYTRGGRMGGSGTAMGDTGALSAYIGGLPASRRKEFLASHGGILGAIGDLSTELTGADAADARRAATMPGEGALSSSGAVRRLKMRTAVEKATGMTTAGMSDSSVAALYRERALGPVGARAYKYGTFDEATAAYSADPKFVTGASGITRGGGARSDKPGVVLGHGKVMGEAYEDILAKAFERSGLHGGAMGLEFLRSTAGVAKTFAGRGGLADPNMAAGLMGLLGGGAWGGRPGVGLEPERAADLASRLFSGTSGMGDSTAYTMKVHALSKMGPMAVKTAFGTMNLDPRNPYDLRSIMERGINEPGVLKSYLEEARSYGPELGSRALTAMTGGAVSDIEARGLLSGKFDVSKFMAGTGSGATFEAAKAAMATKGGGATMMEADIEGNMEALGEKLHELRLDIRDAISEIAKASGSESPIVNVMKALVTEIAVHPGLVTALATGHALSAHDVGSAFGWGAVAGLSDIWRRFLHRKAD